VHRKTGSFWTGVERRVVKIVFLSAIAKSREWSKGDTLGGVVD